MGCIVWLIQRPISQQLIYVAWFIVISFFVFGGCCSENPPKPIRGDITSSNNVAKLFLVSLHDNDLSSMDIYTIEKPSDVKIISRWIKEHVNSSETVKKSRGLVLRLWHDELLRYDEQGHLIASDFLSDGDIISQTDLATLKELFQKYGKQVDTVPGRKKPKKSDNPPKQSLIEKE
jgi:hypothetical protein